MTADPLPRPVLRLYGRAGCGLCDEARAVVVALLNERAQAGRATADLVELDIDADPELQRAMFATIPVIEIDGRRLELATSPAKLRRLLAETLDARAEPEPAGPTPAPAR